MIKYCEKKFIHPFTHSLAHLLEIDKHTFADRQTSTTRSTIALTNAPTVSYIHAGF